MADDKHKSQPVRRKKGSNAKRRRGARQKAMQALYQWDFDQAANRPEQVIRQFCDMQNMDKVDVDYFEALFNYAVENIEAVDAEISQHLDRELPQLDPIERSVLRICCVELKTELGTPYKVVVNEAVEISKDFGADMGYRYINGIADKLAGALRKIEYQHDHPSGNPLSGQQQDRQSAHKKPAGNVKISVKEKTEQPQRDSGSSNNAPRGSSPEKPAAARPKVNAARPAGSSSSTGTSVRPSANPAVKSPDKSPWQKAAAADETASKEPDPAVDQKPDSADRPPQNPGKLDPGNLKPGKLNKSS